METYPILMRHDMQQAARDGRKWAARLTNRAWLKAKKDDRLLVLLSGGLILVMTADAYEQPLHEMGDRDFAAEGLHQCIDQACGCIRNRFIRLWDEIKADSPEEQFAANPTVVVLPFRVEK